MLGYNQSIPSSKQIQVFAVMSVISLLIFAVGTLHITDPVGKAVLFTLSPILSTVNHIQIQIKNEVTIIQEAHLLASKFRASQEQNMSLRSELAQANLILEENKKLREQIGSPEVAQFKLIPAKVISKDREVTLIFDKNPNVTNGSVVVFKNNFVGIIKNAAERSASMILSSDPESRVAVEIITQDKNIVKGVVFGQFGTSIKADQIEQNSNIQKGDLVTLAKTDRLPQGVVVGEVSEIQKIESQLFQSATVTPFFEFEKIDTVFIIQ
jgi:rod shape-determining protein MreC